MTDHNDDEMELEFSSLCGNVTRNGQSVRVQIYRLAGEGGWALEVIDEEDVSTVWEELFTTDSDAYAEFIRTLETEGIQSFSENAADRLH